MKKFTFLVAALCATMMAFATATAVKVTDASTLKAGDKIAIANLDGSQAMSTSQTTSEGKSYYRGVVDFDVKNVTTDVEQVELVASGSNFKLKVTGGYLYFDSSWERNWLGTNATGTDFTFEASGDTLRLKEVASGRYIMYNTQSTPYRFSCYTAGSGARKDGGTSIYTISGEAEETVIENKTIAEFIANKGGKCYLTGVVGKIENDTYGNFNLTDASGTIYVYGCLTADGQSKQFATLGVEQGDTLTVLASVYEVYNSQDEAKDVIYVSHKKAAGEGGGSEGGEGELDYSFEPTEVTTIDETMLEADWIDYTVDGLVLVWLGNEQYEVSLAVLTTKAAMPVGTFEINDSEAENTVLASPGGDETDDYPSFVAANFEGDSYHAAYYLVSGNVTISVAEDVYTIKLDAKSYNGSTIKMAYTGAVEEYTAIRTVEIDNTVYARDGRIYAEEGARIYSLTGLDVTRMNGNLEGIYIVKNGNKVAKVAVAK
ncbi:MAG: hypothetical protein ACI3ZV_07710 [Paludibacteraceae bacterium]